MFGMRFRHNWTFLQFAMVLLNAILIYMMAGLVFPDFFGEEVVDLKESFFSHRGWFFTIGVGTILASVSKDFVLDGRLPQPTNLAFHAVFGTTLLIGAFTRREAYHKTLVLFGIASFILYIVVLFARLQ